MRKMQFLMMVLLMAIAASGQVMAQNTGENNNGSGNDKNKFPTNDPLYLLLLGECESDFPRAAAVPFEAYIVDGVLTVSSQTDLADVTVTLYYEESPVYTQTRDFTFMDSMAIPVAGFPAGNYRLLLTTLRGTYIYATFNM